VPGKRLAFTAIPPPMMTWLALPVFLILAWVPRWPRLPAMLLAGALAAVAVKSILDNRDGAIDGPLVGTAWAIGPAAVVAGSLQLLFGERRGERRPLVFAVIAASGFCGLVQFPVATELYFAFVAPLAVLSTLAVFDETKGASRAPLVVALASFLAISVPVIARVHQHDVSKLDLDRGGIFVTPGHKQQYEDLVKVVRFLAGNQRPQFSQPPSPELAAHLREAYPRSAMVGDFEVRWRE
jgi:hypothetical protein